MQPATEHTHHLRRESRDRNGAINSSHRKQAPPAETEIGQDFASEDVALVEFMYLVFTRMPGESYRRCVCVAVLVLRILSAN